MTRVKSICVFCGASNGKNPQHMENAIAFGKMMAERGITLVYGGGRIGLMGAVADAVAKATLHVSVSIRHGNECTAIRF